MLSVEDAEAYKAEIQRLCKLNDRLEEENAVQARTIRELEAFVDAEKAASVEALRLATEGANNPAVHNIVEDEQATTTSTDTGCTSVTDWDSYEPDVPAVMRMASSNVTVRRKKR
ncbi:hypothetical protein AAVH_01361 [Aphelenchoides avenae]|nr:hypothetical protein AAVH_01361 [Aphelenchus avenae]